MRGILCCPACVFLLASTFLLRQAFSERPDDDRLLTPEIFEHVTATASADVNNEQLSDGHPRSAEAISSLEISSKESITHALTRAHHTRHGKQGRARSRLTARVRLASKRHRKRVLTRNDLTVRARASSKRSKAKRMRGRKYSLATEAHISGKRHKARTLKTHQIALVAGPGNDASEKGKGASEEEKNASKEGQVENKDDGKGEEEGKKEEEGEEDGDDGDDDDDEEEKCEAEEGSKYDELDVHEKIWMHVGWLVLCVGWLVALFAYGMIAGALSPTEAAAESQELQLEPALMLSAQGIMELLNGISPYSTAVSALILILGLLNFYGYAVVTETTLEPGYEFLGMPIDSYKSKATTETFSLVAFSLATLLRLATVHTHPKWRQFGFAAAPRYAIANIYTALELVALGVTMYYAFAAGDSPEHLDLLWLFLARGLEMLERSEVGLGFKQLKRMMSDDGKLLLVASAFGLSVWLVMSGLYFVWNFSNEEAKWCAMEFDRFSSIPSSMWYVLINLLKEHPLADVHQTFGQRVLCCIMCVFAMPVFGLPTAILQNSLFNNGEEDEEAQPAPERAGGLERGTEVDDGPRASIRSRRGSRRSQQLETATEETGSPHFYLGLITTILCVGSIAVYFNYTARGTKQGNSFYLMPITITSKIFAWVDGIVAIFFMSEYAWRLGKGGATYFFSTYSLVDLLSWLPGLYHLCTWVSLNKPENVQHLAVIGAFCVLRIFKFERYLHSFRDMIDIVRGNSGILTATLGLAMLNWLFFSVIFYLTEKNNPEEEMRKDVYGSVMRSLWSEIINLHGEWPWADYTVLGKAVGAIVGVFSVMFFCIPISIFGDGFQAKIEADHEDADDDFDRQPWQQRCRPEQAGIQQTCYDLFYSHLHRDTPTLAARAVRGFFILLVAATTYISVASTVESLEVRDVKTERGLVFLIVDISATVIFSVEYLVRILATGGRHSISLIGLLDLISILAFGYTCIPDHREPSFRPSYEDASVWSDSLVLLRLLRLFSIDNWLHTVHKLVCVLYLNRWPLARTGGALVSTWYVHATLLYLMENPRAFGMPADEEGPAATEHDGESDDVTMAYRYRSILSALQYSIVHLFGDYPETDYNFPARVVQFASIIGGIGIISSFCGVFSAAFINFLHEERSKERAERMLNIMRHVSILKSGLRKAVQRRRERRAQGIQLPPQERISWVRRAARAITFGHGDWNFVRLFFNSTVVVALVNSVVASIPEVDDSELGRPTTIGIELGCTCLFLIEYIVRLVARPRTGISFWGLTELVCCLPGLVIMGSKLLAKLVPAQKDYILAERTFRIVEAMGMMRGVRILHFSYWRHETGIIGQVLRDVIPQLAAPGHLALNVWISTSALFMWLENEYKKEGGTAEDMPDVPSAMYWCCIFLTGEWANVDFTYAASRLCIFYVIFGITMFSIPVGIMTEAVQNTLQNVAEDEKQVKKLLKLENESAMSKRRRELSTARVNQYQRPHQTMKELSTAWVN